MRTILSVIILLLILTACSKEKDTPLSGTESLTSELKLVGQTYSYQGFWFDQGKTGLYNPTQDSAEPDMHLGEMEEGGKIFAYLESPDPQTVFRLVGSYDNIKEAEDYFDSYLQIEAGSWEDWANPVLENQVWLLRTKEENYAKLLILDTLSYIKDSQKIAEIKFKWVYQPDGSKTFPK